MVIVTKIIKNRTLQFIFSLTISTLLFLFSSYIVLVDNYKNIEKGQNTKNITSLINGIEQAIKTNAQEIKLLAISNKTAAFIKDKKDYFSKDFLDYLNIDLLLIKKNHKKLLTKNSSKLKTKNIISLEEKIFNKYRNLTAYSTLVQIEDELFYVSKITIKKHQFYLVKKITETELKKLASNFLDIKIITNHIYAKNDEFKLSSLSFKSIQIENIYNEQENINNISFYDYKNSFLFSIQTKDERLIVNEAKHTILIFTIAVIIFLILLFYITYIYQKIVNSHSDNLEQKVQERTKQIQFTMQELEKANLKLYDIAHTDFLTKTMNRRNFFIHALNLFEKNKNINSIVIVMIDIDNFKQINDTYGHSIGDKVLIAFSSCVKQTLGQHAIFGRLGGEEFAIMFDNTSLDEGIKKADTVRKEIENIKVFIDDELIKITASFGVSDNKNMTSIDEMLQKADKHLYSAKESGKNRVRGRS